MYIYIYRDIYIYIYTHTHTHTYIHIYVCVYINIYRGNPNCSPNLNYVFQARSWSGLIGAGAVERLLEQADALVREGALPWAALTVFIHIDR